MIFNRKLHVLRYASLLFLFLTVNTASASELILDLKQLECDVTIKAIEPAVGSVINLGEGIRIEVDYSFKNVPTGIEIVIFPGIISNESDFQNFLPVAGISLFGDNTLLHDIASPARPVLNGKLHFNYINQGHNTGVFDSLIATLRFSRLANNNDLLRSLGKNIKTGITLLPIASKDIHCKTDITSSVNWEFTDKPNEFK